MVEISDKIKKYYREHTFFENYRGWNIRLHRAYNKYLGVLWYYTCDVRVGLESVMSPQINMVREWIDEKINEGKTQQEDILIDHQRNIK